MKGSMRHIISEKVEPILIDVYRKITDPPPPNLRGDRDIEYSWIAANMPQGPGRGIDFGCGTSYLSMVAVRRGFTMTAIDLTDVSWFYTHPQLKFIRADIFDLDMGSEKLDLIINCSAIEHVGLDRYGSELRPNGDIEAMKRLKVCLKPHATMLLTIPVGRDAVFAPLHRVYGHERLPKLLKGYTTEREEYWVKNQQNHWMEVDRDSALKWEARPTCYGLGCLVLRKA